MLDLAASWIDDGFWLTLNAFGVEAAWLPGGPVRIFDPRGLGGKPEWRRDDRPSHDALGATARVAAMVAIMEVERDKVLHLYSQHAAESPRVTRKSKMSEIDRAERWIAKCDPSIAGAGGAASLMRVVGGLTRKFPTLSLEQRLMLLRRWDANNQPPWREPELRRALRNAARKSA